MNKAAPKLGAIDLNLLVVFDAIMRDRSVTRAGQRLRLSQPAMSHALARLRHMLKDELFVRSPNGMVPMPRTEELATPVPVGNQIRTYWWCNPPRIGVGRMRPKV